MLDALNRGLSHKEVSELFGLSLSTIKRYVKRRQGEDLEPRPSTGRKRRILAPTQQKRAPWRQLEENDEATLERHCELWEERQGLPREQLREEPLGIPQERAFALHAPKLLQEGEGDDLGVRKPLYGLVAASAAGVEEAVGVVYEAEKHGLRASSRWGSEWVCWCRAIRGSFRRGFGWPSLYPQSMQHTSSRYWRFGTASIGRSTGEAVLSNRGPSLPFRVAPPTRSGILCSDYRKVNASRQEGPQGPARQARRVCGL